MNRHSVVSKFYFTFKLGKQILGFENIAVFISLLNLFLHLSTTTANASGVSWRAQILAEVPPDLSL